MASFPDRTVSHVLSPFGSFGYRPTVLLLLYEFDLWAALFLLRGENFIRPHWGSGQELGEEGRNRIECISPAQSGPQKGETIIERNSANCIGVIGQSGNNPAVEEMSATIGRKLLKRVVFSTPGRDGVMMAASRGPGGGRNNGGHPARKKIEEGNPYLDIPITTGFGLDYRSLILVHTCDAIIMVGARAAPLVSSPILPKTAGRWLF